MARGKCEQGVNALLRSVCGVCLVMKGFKAGAAGDHQVKKPQKTLDFLLKIVEQDWFQLLFI